MPQVKLIYVASPYHGDTEQNVEYARRACRYVLEQGHIPFAPHLIYPQFLDEDKPEERKRGLAAGLAILFRCDALWAFGPNISEGMRGEISTAEYYQIPVEYLDEDGTLFERGGKNEDVSA